ncbi:hypothetical protein [Mucilaginibacter pedocola]|uniref:Uncharacterized protein n=1 Tax=Mucilaginibacter pedocola TaxID=1792845 RepID=A0A1S9PH42_9SPHI|nr:hypothetical protein [Mucilaginibacter pedocola]OOQ60260.1 hypothetical protein BC343_26245 [Mucilaginibacter pedocola]
MVKFKNLVQGDILSFVAADNKYKAILCTAVKKDRSPHSCDFAATTYSSENLPTLDNILQCDFYGRPNAQSSSFPYPQTAINVMWEVHPEIKPYILGSYGLTIWNVDLKPFEGNFELIGNLNIVSDLLMNGNGSVNASSWDFFSDFFAGNGLDKLLERGHKPFSIRAIVMPE